MPRGRDVAEPFRGEQLRSALAALLGETWPLRTSMLVESDAPRREALHVDLAALAARGEVTPAAVDAVRRALVEGLRHGSRDELLRDLDRELLGVGARSGTLLRAS